MQIGNGLIFTQVNCMSNLRTWKPLSFTPNGSKCIDTDKNQPGYRFGVFGLHEAPEAEVIG